MYRVFALVLTLFTVTIYAQPTTIDVTPQQAPNIPPPPPQEQPIVEKATTDPNKPSMEFDQKEVKFGAQGVGIQACQYVLVKNTTDQSQIIVGLASGDPHFSVPSPSQAMLPITIRRGGTLTLSVCFTPDKVGTVKSDLTMRTARETFKLPLIARGIKPEDVAKLPQTELSIKAPKKKQKDWTIDLKMPKAAKLVMQLLDPLGNPVKTYINNEIMHEGNYEFIFAGVDSQGRKLEAGTYYVRMTGSEMFTNKEVKLTKMFTFKP